MKTTALALVLIAAGSFAAAQESVFGPLPDIHFGQLRGAPPAFSVQPGQSSPLDVQVQNQMFGVGQIFVSCGFDGDGENCLLDTGSNVFLVKCGGFFD